ncbi:MAG: M20/M25/M40 family metallo-hydrolase [Bryobacteraceae bacterium]|nr:M20/M25/M40 family metallo-hydrolase [Bryobacteraceae bacterium]
MRLVTLAACAWAFAALPAHAAPPPAIAEAKAFEEEVLKHHAALVRLDTTNPPGNETRAVEYLKKVLDAEGIPSVIVGAQPARMNLIARLKGTGSKKPILLMGHTDTVSIDAKKWVNHGPFSADNDGTYIYGRGSTDDKDSVATYLTVLLTLKRQKVALDRDVIFFAEAAEEAGAGTVGAKWVLDNHGKEIEAEFCLAEGGGGRREKGKLLFTQIQTAEKMPRGATLIARGPAGHGSRPTPGNAVLALANAVTAAATWMPPMKLNDTTRAYFERLAAISPPGVAERYTNILRADKAGEVQAWFKANDPAHYSTVTTSITPTIIKAGYQFNVIPSEAEAMLDIRMLPDEDMDQFFEGLRKVIDNPNVEVVPRSTALRPRTPPTGLDTPMFKAIESTHRELFGGIRVIPTMGVGATDMSYMRETGMQCYGVGPAVDVEDTGLGYGAHSDQERVLVQGLRDFARFAWGIVTTVAARQ